MWACNRSTKTVQRLNIKKKNTHAITHSGDTVRSASKLCIWATSNALCDSYNHYSQIDILIKSISGKKSLLLYHKSIYHIVTAIFHLSSFTQFIILKYVTVEKSNRFMFMPSHQSTRTKTKLPKKGDVTRETTP